MIARRAFLAFLSALGVQMPPILRPMRNGSVDVDNEVSDQLQEDLNDVLAIQNTALLIAMGTFAAAGTERSTFHCGGVKTATGIYEVTLTSTATNAHRNNIIAAATIQIPFGATPPVKGSIVVIEPDAEGDPFVVKTYVDGVATDQPFSVTFTSFHIPVG